MRRAVAGRCRQRGIQWRVLAKVTGAEPAILTPVGIPIGAMPWPIRRTTRAASLLAAAELLIIGDANAWRWIILHRVAALVSGWIFKIRGLLHKSASSLYTNSLRHARGKMGDRRF